MHESVALTRDERALLAGRRGPGVAMAMRLIVRLAEVMEADRLLPIERAHIDSCLFHGQSGLDFVHRLVDGGATVVVPTTLNVASLDLLHPELVKGDDGMRSDAKALMDAYVALGCEPTWTCAPYQRLDRPEFGQHIAWAESNAIVFANSVLGARTHRYGDFIDIAAAVTGLVPEAGLHLEARRHATRIIDVTMVPHRLLDEDIAYPCLGFVIGRLCGSAIPAIVGLASDTSEDRLKALGAAAASSGSIAMFHVVGRTPEAPTLADACGGRALTERTMITADQLRSARDALSTDDDIALATVSLGTPHYSVAEIGRLHQVLAGRAVHRSVALYVSTSREVLHECMLHGWVETLEASGVSFVTDTCTYITPIVRDTTGLAMTDSAKWAYYAPANIGVTAMFASLHECVESAVAGTIRRDDRMWLDD